VLYHNSYAFEVINKAQNAPKCTISTYKNQKFSGEGPSSVGGKLLETGNSSPDSSPLRASAIQPVSHFQNVDMPIRTWNSVQYSDVMTVDIRMSKLQKATQVQRVRLET